MNLTEQNEPKKKRKKRKPTKDKGNIKSNQTRLLAIGAVVVAACLLLVCGGVLIKAVYDKKTETKEAALISKEANQQAEDAKAKQAEADEQEKQEENLIDLFTQSGKNVYDAIKKRPPSIELTADNTKEFVKINSCKIEKEKSKIIIKAEAEGIPISDDKYYYLFALKPYIDEISEDMEPLIQGYKDIENTFKLARFFTGTESGELYKFVVAVKKNGKYVAVSNPHYITNPEAVAKYNSRGETPSSKKGLLIDPNKLRTDEMDVLGVKHATYNIPVSRILGQSTDATYPTIQYSYNGKSYSFNGQVMSEYDLVFRTLTNKGIEITAIILNDISAAYPQLIHPRARTGLGKAPYYAFNATDQEGLEYIGAIGAFLAERYSGTVNGRGFVANWIIGNEINIRSDWNYMEYTNLQDYVEEYARAYRIFYKAIKSINAASNIYISLDQQWNRNISSSKNYDARDFLEEFTKQIKAEGNIDWGLAIHPYNAPLTTVATWAASKYVKDSVDTPMITMANIHVVTDYMQQKEFLQEDGEVRSIILSEQGFSSLSGQELQAAAIVYAYKVAEANPHIDALLLSRETDAPEEVLQGLAFGLNNVDGSHKYAWNVYRYMDTDKQKEYTDFAKDIIGISDWSQVIKSR